MKHVIEETHQQRNSGGRRALPVQTAPLPPEPAPKRECADRGPHLPLRDVRVGKNCLRVYQSGYELYDAMLEAIDTAQESIYLKTYIWKADAVGQAFKEHLVHKARQGVAVYVIFDGFANTVVPRDFKAFPTMIHVLHYQALHRPWHILDPRRYALDHRKQLIVDGSLGFLGGYNLGKVYAASWRDTHLSIHGPAAADLARSFVRFWNQHHRKRDHIHKHYPCHFDPLVNVRETSALQLTFPIRDMYIDAINRAEQTIRLTNAYFVPDRTLLATLKAAAQRGVDVQVLVPWISNHRVVDWFARASFAECLKAGIRVFTYQRMLHAKTCTIDGQWTTIGTANLDRLSSVGNYESNAEVYSQPLAHQMEALFHWDLNSASEILPQQWSKRPWYLIAASRCYVHFGFSCSMTGEKRFHQGDFPRLYECLTSLFCAIRRR